MSRDEPQPISHLLLVGAALLALVAISYGLSLIHLPGWNLPLALGIALVKCSLVMLVFMELWSAHGAVRLIASVGLAYVLVLVILSAADPATRSPPVAAPPAEAPAEPR